MNIEQFTILLIFTTFRQNLRYKHLQNNVYKLVNFLLISKKNNVRNTISSINNFMNYTLKIIHIFFFFFANFVKILNSRTYK